MSEITPFFAKDENLSELRKFSEITAQTMAERAQQTGWEAILTALAEIVRSMGTAPDMWDSHCQFNIKRIGNTFIGNIKNTNADPHGTNFSIDYAQAFAFLCELDLSTPNDTNMPHHLQSILNRHDTNIGDANVRAQLNYARCAMPIAILKSLSKDNNILSFRNFEAKKEEAVQFAENMRKEREDHARFMDSQKSEVQKLADALKEQKYDYTFVLLNDGFARLEAKKSAETATLRRILIAFGASLMLIPLGAFLLRLSDYSDWGMFLSLTSAEIVLIYLFRIILLNYKAAKSQVIQLELRMALCQFVQNYAEYAGDVKNKDVLHKFENIIFSEIIPNPEGLPGAFDGIKQITNLLKDAPKKGGGE